MNVGPREPLILLCSARSFSSVTNAMLGQHPDMFALPEQNLFLADTLGQLHEIEEAMGRRGAYLAGLKRAVAHLEFGEQTESAIEEASVWIRRRWFWRFDRTFRFLQEKAASSILVYKSPRTAMSKLSAKRMLTAAPSARYLHLVREPGSAVAEWVRTVPCQTKDANRFFAEIWLQCQQTILDLETSMEGRILRIRGEDVVNRPVESMRKIVTWLDLLCGEDDIAPMLHPENWHFAHALPGCEGDDNDIGFSQQPWIRLTPEPGLSVDQLGLDRALEKKMESLAEKFGYL